jgi:hypothetical protein
MEFGTGKVFCIGLPRTGTTSLGHAGNILGYIAMHTNPELAGFIGIGKLFIGTEKDDIHNFFSDEPYCSFFKTYYMLYPKAKFILSTRDLTKWKESMKWMFKTHQIYWDATMRKFQRKIWKIPPKFYDGEIDDVFLENWYFKHHGDVINTIPKNQLLIFTLEEQDKWGKICNFLGKPIPSYDFPYYNKKTK